MIRFHDDGSDSKVQNSLFSFKIENALTLGTADGKGHMKKMIYSYVIAQEMHRNVLR